MGFRMGTLKSDQNFKSIQTSSQYSFAAIWISQKIDTSADILNLTLFRLVTADIAENQVEATENLSEKKILLFSRMVIEGKSHFKT